MEDANSEFDVWFVDTEAFAEFDPDTRERLMNVVGGEVVPVKLVTPLD